MFRLLYLAFSVFKDRQEKLLLTFRAAAAKDKHRTSMRSRAHYDTCVLQQVQCALVCAAIACCDKTITNYNNVNLRVTTDTRDVPVAVDEVGEEMTYGITGATNANRLHHAGVTQLTHAEVTVKQLK